MAKVNLYGYLLSCLLILIVAQVGVATVAPLLGWKKLIIGVPKKTGFTEFVDVELNSSTKQLIKVTGYSIDIFKAAVDYISSYSGFNVSYEFRPFMNISGESAGSYDELVEQICKGKEYDAVVGDISIVANRTKCVDFTLPYAESGVRMLIRAGHHQSLNMWIFVRPFSWDLWLSITTACVFIGATIQFMERNIDIDAEPEGSPRREKLKRISIIWLPLAQLVLPNRESVAKNWSKFVLFVWLILGFVLMQSYAANLSSILVVDKLKPSYPSVNDLKRNGDNIGYPTGSFLFDKLVDLKFDKLKLKNISNVEDYKKALDNGTSKGGVAVIFDEIPYIKMFIKKYGSKYMMVGPQYRTDGLGYAFPVNSNLTAYFSRAILNVTQSALMDNIERRHFGSSDDDDDVQLSDTPSLTTYSFAGLFMITGIVTVLALVASESHIWRKPITLVKVYSTNWLLSPRWTKDNNQSVVVDSATRGNVSVVMNEADSLQCRPSWPSMSPSTQAIETLHVYSNSI